MKMSGVPARLLKRHGLAAAILGGTAMVLAGAPRDHNVERFTTRTANSQPGAIVAGPDGALWFTEPGINAIGRITTAGVISEFAIPTGGSLPSSITVGPDGNIWFTESNAGQIGTITTGGSISEFSIADGGQPVGIAAGPDGNIWFADAVGGGIAVGPDGNIWFIDTQSNTIRSITSFGKLRKVKISANRPQAITAGPDGALWFTEKPNRIGRIDLTRRGD
jgi:virginiamycin B lyase